MVLKVVQVHITLECAINQWMIKVLNLQCILQYNNTLCINCSTLQKCSGIEFELFPGRIIIYEGVNRVYSYPDFSLCCIIDK